MSLVILNDPSGITGRRELELDTTISLQANLARAMPQGGGDCELFIDGGRVDPLTDARLDATPAPGMRVVLAHRPAGLDPVTWGYIISAVLVVASYAMIPRPQSEAAPKDSPNNRLTGQTNVARVYQAIPDVYGYRRVWPDLIQPASIEYRNNVKRITHWLCVSRGLGTLSGFKIADNDASSVVGAEWFVFSPGEAPPTQPGFAAMAAPPDPPQPAGEAAGYPEFKATRLVGITEPFQIEGSTDVELAGFGPYTTVDAGPASGFTVVGPSTLVTVTFPDGPQWAQIKAAALPLSLAEVIVQEQSGPGRGSYTGSITARSVASGSITLTVSLSAAIGQLLPFAWTLRPSGSTSPIPAGPYVSPISDANAVRLNIVFPRGLKGSAEVGVTVVKLDAAGAVIPGTTETTSAVYTADTFEAQYRTLDFVPAGGPGRYRITTSRIDVPATDGSNLAKLEAVYALRIVAHKDLPLGLTVVKFVITANPQTQDLRELRFNLMWQRHVRTLDGGSISASRNFARAMAHVWTIAGGSIAELDTAKLADINARLGETSPMLRFDGSFDDADLSLGDRLQRIAFTARCSLWRDGNVWTVSRDEARDAPELQLDYRNLSQDGESAVSYSGHLPASHDGVEIEYTDEATQASKAFVRLSIASGTPVAGDPLNPLKLQLPGCATQAQAENRAQLEARRLLYQRTTVSDRALADAGSLGHGSLVRWVDPSDFAGDDGLQAGEVLSIAASVITVSEPLDWRGQASGRMIFTGIDGAPLGAPVVVWPAPDGAVALASVPAGLYVADGSSRQLGSRYAFAAGLTDAEVQAAGLYVLTRGTPQASGKTVSIALANYDERMYAAD